MIEYLGLRYVYSTGTCLCVSVSFVAHAPNDARFQHSHHMDIFILLLLMLLLPIYGY